MFLVMRKVSFVTDANKVAKTKKNGDYNIFQFFSNAKLYFEKKGKPPFVKGHKAMPIHIFCSRTKFRDYVAEYQAFLGEKGKIISSPLTP